MRLEERIEDWYLQQGFNCAESIFLACNDHYNLGYSIEDARLFSGYGSGMYTGHLCGALNTSIAVASRIVVKSKAHDHMKDLAKIDAAIIRNFKEMLGGENCAALKPVHFHPETRCYTTTFLAARALEKSLESFGIYPAKSSEE